MDAMKAVFGERWLGTSSGVAVAALTIGALYLGGLILIRQLIG
jgi:hypothetical protein